MQVDVVEGRDAVVVAGALAEDRERPVGDDLVDVHVGAGAGSALQGVDQHVLRQQAFGHLAAGLLDGVGLGGVVGPGAERAVGARAGQLDGAVGADQLLVHRPAGQREVLQGPHGVDAVQGVGRDLAFAQQVVLHRGVPACEPGAPSCARQPAPPPAVAGAGASAAS